MADTQLTQGFGQGLVKGLSVTLRTMLHRSVTVQYPDWCIYIDAHKETHPPSGGGRARSAKILDRFAIDYALCMYCGICVEACPFDALFWAPDFDYSEYDIHELIHEKDKLED